MLHACVMFAALSATLTVLVGCNVRKSPNIYCVFVQTGVVSDEAAKIVTDAGMQCVMDKCIGVEVSLRQNKRRK